MGEKIKSELDGDLSVLPQIIDECIAATKAIIYQNNLLDRSIDGLSFQDFMQMVASGTRKQYGL